MISVMIRMADALILAEYKPVEIDNKSVNMWVGESIDLFSAKRCDFRVDGEAFAAILALGLHGVGEDKTPGYDIDKLYTVATDAMKNWPFECKPIP